MKNLIFVLLAAFTGCSTFHGAEKPMVHHVVLCRLKDHGNTAQRRSIVEASRSFESIPGVIQVRAGEPLTTSRETNDSSFDVAVIISFANQQDLQAYLSNPAHLKAKEDILIPLAEKILVYDFKE